MNFLYLKNVFSNVICIICFVWVKIWSNSIGFSDHADWISPGHHFVQSSSKGGRWTHKTWEASFVRLSHLREKTGLFISLLSLAQVIVSYFLLWCFFKSRWMKNCQKSLMLQGRRKWGCWGCYSTPNISWYK